MTARIYDRAPEINNMDGSNNKSSRHRSSRRESDLILSQRSSRPPPDRPESHRASSRQREREEDDVSGRGSRVSTASERRRSAPPRGVAPRPSSSRSNSRRYSSVYNHSSRHSSSGASIGSIVPPPPPPPPPRKREDTKRPSPHSDASQNTDSTYPSTEGHHTASTRATGVRSDGEGDDNDQQEQSSSRQQRSRSSMKKRSQSVGRGEQRSQSRHQQRSASRGAFGGEGRSESRSRYNSMENNTHRSESRSRYSTSDRDRGGWETRSESRSRFSARSESRSSRYGGRSESRSRYENGRSPEHRFDGNNRRSQSRSKYDNGRASSRMSSRRSESRSRRSYHQVDHKDVGNADTPASEAGDVRRSMSRQRSRRFDDNDTHDSSPPPRSSASRGRGRRSESRSRASSRPRPSSRPPPQEDPCRDYRKDPATHEEDTCLKHPTPESLHYTAPKQRSSNEINLVIDSAGHGTFHIATKGLCNTNSKKSQSHLTFDIQIDESSQRYLIHTSMGKLDKIRHIHPGMNILRTLSYWNNLQKRRYGNNPTEIVRGGQLGIVAKNRTNLVTMTLMGEYSHRAWEYDDVFQRELERFVEDALQFHLCLNGDGSKGGGGETNKETGGGNGSTEKVKSPDSNVSNGMSTNKSSSTLGSNGHLSGGSGGGLAEQYYVAEGPAPSTSHKMRGKSNFLGKVLQKVNL